METTMTHGCFVTNSLTTISEVVPDNALNLSAVRRNGLWFVSWMEENRAVSEHHELLQ